MRRVWAVAAALFVMLAANVYADTVYLKDGQTVWGKEVSEEANTVVVTRPGETLRFPKQDVRRIERERVSVPRYYEPPSAKGEGPAGATATQPPPPTATPPSSSEASDQPAPTMLPPAPPPQ